MRHGRQILEHDLVAVEPFPVGMAAGQRGFELLVRNEAALVEIDQQHLAGLQPPFGDDVPLRDRQHAHLGSHDDAVVAREKIAGGAQAVAVERGADLPAVGERDGGGTVPWLHQRGIVFVEGAPLLIHQRVAGPGLRNHHHHGVRKPVAALHQKFERIVEAGGVGLALVGDRPQLVDVLAVQRRGHGSLAGRHPIEVAAQRIDLAVVGDHPVGMRERPGREGVGREALVHERERACEIRVVQIRIIGAELVGEEHALVDDGAAGDRDRVIAGEPPLAALIDRVRDRLAQEIQAPLEFGLVADFPAAADEDLLVHGLGGLHGFAERRIVGRYIAPAQERHALALDHLGVNVADHLPPVGIARHEQHADRVFAGRRQAEAEPAGLRGEERVRNLDQDAGAVAGARIGADGAAMLEIAEDRQGVLDDLVRFFSFDVGDKADAAGAFAERRIVETLHRRRLDIGGVRPARRGYALGSARLRPCSAIPDLAHLEPHRRREPGLRRNLRLPRRRSAPRARGEPPLWSLATLSLAAFRTKRVAAHVRRRKRCPTIAHPPAPKEPGARPLQRRTVHRLGQQHCPNAACQILATETSVLLPPNSSSRLLCCAKFGHLASFYREPRRP